MNTDNLSTPADKDIEHKAQMFSFRILSEVELLCKKRNINKKELAELLGTSASYITQLYRGHKMVNMALVGKIESVFKIRFDIKAKKPAKITWSNI